MERAVIYLVDKNGGERYINVLADRMDEKDGFLCLYYDDELRAVFLLSEVKAAYLSIKDIKKV